MWVRRDAGHVRSNEHMKKLFALLFALALLRTVGGVDLDAPPSITSQPRSQDVAEGAPALLSVRAEGSRPLGYQWFKTALGGAGRGLSIPGAVLPDLYFQTAHSNESGIYSVAVSNRFGTVFSEPALLRVQAWGPVINLQPASTGVYSGANASFQVTATGTVPLTYLWYRDGQPLPLARTAQLHLPGVTVADAGVYTVLVTNPAGSITSEPALLTVTNAPPLVVAQSDSFATPLGRSTNLFVTAVGSLPLSYRWFKDGATTPVLFATGPTLTIVAALTNDSGIYTAVVSNQFGTVTSAPMALVVRPFPPTIEVQPQSQNVRLDTAVVLQTRSSGSPPFLHRWYKNGVSPTNLVWAETGPNLAFSAAKLTDNGTYYLQVSNPYGVAVSDPAVLTVVPPTSRKLRLGGLQTAAGVRLLVPADLRGRGNENFVSFTAGWNPAVLTLLEVTTPIDTSDTNAVLPSRTNGPPVVAGPVDFAVDYSRVGEGLVGVTFSLPPELTLRAGTNRIANLLFDRNLGGAPANAALGWYTNPVPIMVRGTFLGTNDIRLAVEPQVLPTLLVSTDEPQFAPQSGLFLQTLHVVNSTVSNLPNARVAITGLDHDTLTNLVRVQNRFGMMRLDGTNSAPYVDYGPISTGNSVGLTFEYYVSDRTSVPHPHYAAAIPPRGSVRSYDFSTSFAVKNVTLQGPTVLLDFNTVTNGGYHVRYSDDLVNWNISIPAIRGTGSKMQWVDDGPPKTLSRPGETPVRVYHMIQFPFAALGIYNDYVEYCDDNWWDCDDYPYYYPYYPY